jgi:hypothetical protein
MSAVERYEQSVWRYWSLAQSRHDASRIRLCVLAVTAKQQAACTNNPAAAHDPAATHNPAAMTGNCCKLSLLAGSAASGGPKSAHGARTYTQQTASLLRRTSRRDIN